MTDDVFHKTISPYAQLYKSILINNKQISYKMFQLITIKIYFWLMEHVYFGINILVEKLKLTINL